MSEIIPVTPAVTLNDECGTANDYPVPVEMEGVSYEVSMFNEADGIWLVLALPEPGYEIVPDEAAGWGFYHSGAEGSLLVFPESFTDEPCQEPAPPVEEVAVPPPPPTPGEQIGGTLPATGVEPILAVTFIGALLVTALGTAMIWARELRR